MLPWGCHAEMPGGGFSTGEQAADRVSVNEETSSEYGIGVPVKEAENERYMIVDLVLDSLTIVASRLLSD